MIELVSNFLLMGGKGVLITVNRENIFIFTVHRENFELSQFTGKVETFTVHKENKYQFTKINLRFKSNRHPNRC